MRAWARNRIWAWASAGFWAWVRALRTAGLLLGLAAVPALAQPTSSFRDGIAYFEDEAGTQTIASITAMPDKDFTDSGGRDINLGIMDSEPYRLWVRVKPRSLPLTTSSTRILVLSEPTILSAVLYHPDGKGGWLRQEWTRDNPTGAGPARSLRFAAFSLHSPVLESETIYLQITPFSRIFIPIHAEEPATFLESYNRETLLFGILFGILALSVFYAVSLAVVTRSAAFFALAAGTAGVLTQSAAVKGFLYYLAPRITPPGVYYVADLGVKVAYVSLCCLTLFIIDPPMLRRHRKLLVSVFAFAFLVPYIVDLAGAVLFQLPNHRPYAAIYLVLSYAVVALLTATGMVNGRARMAGLFIACWTPMLIMGAVRTTLDFGSTPERFSLLVVNGFYIALVVSILLFAIFLSALAWQEARRMENELRLSEQRFRDFTQSTSDAYFETDSFGRFMRFSGPPALAALAGNATDAVLAGIGAEQTAALEEARPLADAFAGRQPFRAIRLFLKPGEEEGVVLALSGRPVFDEAAAFTGFRGTISDITLQEQAARREAQHRSLVSLGLLTGSIAHEINNMLHPIINLAAIVRETLPAGSREAGFMRIIDDCANHAGHIVRRVLGFAKAGERGEMLPFADAARQGLDQLHIFITTHRLTTAIDVSGGPRVGRTEMFQVLSNLIANAQAATPREQRIHVALDTVPEGNAMRLSVNDEGKGISAEQAARLTAREDGPEPALSVGPDRGLGLSIVRSIVQGWGGALAARVNDDGGTCVQITVPLPPSDLPTQGAMQ